MTEHALPTPMFPLGTVLMPTAGVRLHVFEPRYRQLVDDVLAGSGEFGVVLIERGSEVGGGDVRSSIGCMARIVGTDQLDDGRWYLAIVGDRRIRVERWLEDDPYPRAETVDLDDEPMNEAGRARTLEEGGRLAGRLRSTCFMAAQLGIAAGPPEVELDDDPAVASFQIAALGPFTEFDRQRVLASTRLFDRQLVLEGMFDDVEFVLMQQVWTKRRGG